MQAGSEMNQQAMLDMEWALTESNSSTYPLFVVHDKQWSKDGGMLLTQK